MSVFDLLTDNDKDLIERYIKAYGASNNEQIKYTKWKGLPIVLKEWANNKDTLSTLLDNQLILHRPYSYTAQTEALSRNIENAFKSDYEAQAFYKWWIRLAYTERPSVSVQIEHTDNNYCSTDWQYYIGTCFSSEVLATNQYLNNNCIITFPSETKMKIFRGMKPMKILHRIVQEFDGPEDTFDAFRIWHSRQLNQKTVDGELCLSIHPLDYMTMSDNDNDWTSCMRWQTETTDAPGDYRGGTVSCLNSPYILVAYLHNPKHTYSSFWNSKQWRELFIVQDGIINEIKGYPFQDQYLTNTCLMWIKELAEKNLGWTYENEEINVVTEIKNPNDNTPILFTFNPGTFMYNDMGTLDIHRGRINLDKLLGKYKLDQVHKENKIWKTFIDIDYGGIATCMCCGKELCDDEIDSSCVLCADCDSISRCPHCGRAIYECDDKYWVEEYNDYICEECWENCCGWDNFTDEPHLAEELTPIYVLLGQNNSGKDVFLDEIAYCYKPEDNAGFDDIFNGPTLDNGYCQYVTLDMIRPGQENNFKDIFYLSRDVNLSTLINDYI